MKSINDSEFALLYNRRRTLPTLRLGLVIGLGCEVYCILYSFSRAKSSAIFIPGFLSVYNVHDHALSTLCMCDHKLIPHYRQLLNVEHICLGVKWLIKIMFFINLCTGF